MKRKPIRMLTCLTVLLLLVAVTAIPAFASGDVATAIEGTWTAAQGQVKTVVNNVVFPVIDMILAICLTGLAISSPAFWVWGAAAVGSTAYSCVTCTSCKEKYCDWVTVRLSMITNVSETRMLETGDVVL